MEGQIYREDLRWWLDLAPSLEWTWARTYADSAPHWYAVLGTTPGMGAEDFVRAARVIRTFGQPGRFWRSTNIYLHDARTGKKWWTMDSALERTTLVNMADASVAYGPQDAPPTLGGGRTDYDSIATVYDQLQTRVNPQVAEDIDALLRGHLHGKTPTTLDVGCGTGLALDLGITRPERYTGIDPSQGMLNQLVLKHPQVSQLYPGPASAMLPGLGPRPFELVCSLSGAASYLDREDWEQMLDLSSELVVFMTWAEGCLPSYWEGQQRAQMWTRTELARRQMLQFAADHEAVRSRLGPFDVTILQKRPRVD